MPCWMTGENVNHESTERLWHNPSLSEHQMEQKKTGMVQREDGRNVNKIVRYKSWKWSFSELV